MKPFCNSDIWAKLSFLEILLHWPPKQLLPLTNTSKLSQIQIKLLDTMNAEALKCFQNFVFCCVVYTLTYSLAILKPIRSGKQSLMVESIRSKKARNGAHPWLCRPARLIKLFKLLSMLTSVLWKRNSRFMMTTADQCTMCSQNHL